MTGPDTVSQRRIHAIATTPQYRRHVEAIWKHISPDVRGEMRTERGASTRNWPSEDVVLIGGFYDMDRVPNNPMVYVEHGAGQSYAGDERLAIQFHPAYHGSSHPENVIGYISPNQRVADSWGRPAFVAGCPALDRHRQKTGSKLRESVLRVAAITFHWDAKRVCPEAWSAKQHYIDYLHNMVMHLRTEGFEVLGTWHPRDPFGKQAWINLGVEHTPDPDEVLHRASLLVADNTSLQYEAAKLGIPQVVLNAPWYRRDVEHGLRFWDHLPGQQINTPEEFMAMNVRGYFLSDKPYIVARSAGDYAFEREIGGAGEAAARWIEKLAGELS